MSIRKKMSLLFVGLAFALLAVISLVQYRSYSSQIEASVNNLLLEQVNLIVNNLDQYRTLDQINFVARTVYQLEKVKEVAIFDKDCNLLAAKPRNAKIRNSCAKPDADTLIFINQNLFSQSSQSIKHILMTKNDRMPVFDRSFFFFLIILPLIVIIAFLAVLRFALGKNVFQPLDQFGDLVASELTLPNKNILKEKFPAEFEPIIDSLSHRDSLILEAQKKLVKQVELESYMKISHQVAHDIRSPLGAFKAAVSTIDTHPEASTKLIQKALQRMESILSELIYRKENKENKSQNDMSFNLKELLLEIIQEKQIENKTLKILFSADQQGTSRLLFGQHDTVLRIVSNILNNSIEACSVDPQVIISVEESEFLSKVSFSDNGRGISKDKIEKVTAYGYTTKATGSGFGLAHARESMESFGGSLNIKSTLGAGTVVELAFRIKTESP